jgi:DNA mismatch repair ATPase MutS
LYKIRKELASKSYGLNVARLAGISENILKIAHEKATEFEKSVAHQLVLKDVLKSLQSAAREQIDETECTCIAEKLQAAQVKLRQLGYSSSTSA